MSQTIPTVIPDLTEQNYQRVLDGWLACQKHDGVIGGQISEAQLAEQSRRFLAEVRKGVEVGIFDDLSGPEWDSTRDLLNTVAAERAVQGFSPSETAVFVFSLKEPLSELLREGITDVEVLARETWVTSLLIDKLGLYTVEVYQKGREEVIRRQEDELLELSTPVIQLWDSILAVPLIGTLDSARTQTVNGESSRTHRRLSRRSRDHRHHWCANRRYAGGSASHQDRLGGKTYGGRLHR